MTSNDTQPRRPLFQEIKLYCQDVYKASSKFIECHQKLARARQQLNFNLRCKRNNVIPKSLRLNSPLQFHEAITYFRTTLPKKCLTFFINYDHRRINNLTKEIEDLK